MVSREVGQNPDRLYESEATSPTQCPSARKLQKKDKNSQILRLDSLGFSTLVVQMQSAIISATYNPSHSKNTRRVSHSIIDTVGRRVSIQEWIVKEAFDNWLTLREKEKVKAQLCDSYHQKICSFVGGHEATRFESRNFDHDLHFRPNLDDARGRRPDTTLEPPVARGILAELDINTILPNPKFQHDSNFDPDLHFRPNLNSERERKVTTALEPPIFKRTLSKLDVTKILPNPKLRHDINFEPDLHFQPNLDGEKGRRISQKSGDFWQTMRGDLQDYIINHDQIEGLGEIHEPNLKIIAGIIRVCKILQEERKSMDEHNRLEDLLHNGEPSLHNLEQENYKLGVSHPNSDGSLIPTTLSRCLSRSSNLDILKEMFNESSEQIHEETRVLSILNEKKRQSESQSQKSSNTRYRSPLWAFGCFASLIPITSAAPDTDLNNWPLAPYTESSTLVPIANQAISPATKILDPFLQIALSCANFITNLSIGAIVVGTAYYIYTKFCHPRSLSVAKKYDSTRQLGWVYIAVFQGLYSFVKEDPNYPWGLLLGLFIACGGFTYSSCHRGALRHGMGLSYGAAGLLVGGILLCISLSLLAQSTSGTSEPLPDSQPQLVDVTWADILWPCIAAAFLLFEIIGNAVLIMSRGAEVIKVEEEELLPLYDARGSGRDAQAPVLRQNHLDDSRHSNGRIQRDVIGIMSSCEASKNSINTAEDETVPRTESTLMLLEVEAPFLNPWIEGT